MSHILYSCPLTKLDGVCQDFTLQMLWQCSLWQTLEGVPWFSTDNHMKMSLYSQLVILYMRCSEVIGVNIMTRCHVGGILSVNKNRVKMQTSEILGQCYSQTVFFDWRIIPHTTVSKHMQNYDVTLMQQAIPPTWRRWLFLIEWGNCHPVYIVSAVCLL